MPTPASNASSTSALISWMLGYPDRSLDELDGSGRKRRDAREPTNPRPNAVSMRRANSYLSPRATAAADYAGRALRICEEQRIAQFHAMPFA